MSSATRQPSPAGPAPAFGRDLTTGSIPRHLIAFSLPMLAGSVLQTAYSFVDAIWVGQFQGTSALAAIAVSFPVIFVLTALGAGMTLATNILVSQHYGAGDLRAIPRIVSSSTVLVGVLSLALMAAGEGLAPLILRAMRTPPEVLPQAAGYLRIYLLSLPLGFGLFLSRSALQGVGDSATPLYFQALGVGLNALLDPVLMLGLLGLPALGLNGAAWATVIAHAVALAALAILLRRRRSPVAPRVGGFHWPTVRTTVRIGLPSAVQQSLISVGMAFVTGIINRFGPQATAAFGAAARIDQWAFLPAMTFSLAVATLAGQNIGARRHHRVRQVLLWGCLLSGGATLILSAVVVSLPGVLLRIFTDDPAVLAIGTRYLRIVGSCYLFFAIMFVSNGIINGAGHTLVTTAFSLISQWVIRVPVAYGLSRAMGRVEGVWYAIAASFGVSMTCSLAYYFSGRWRRPVVRPRVVPPTPQAVYGDQTGEA